MSTERSDDDVLRIVLIVLAVIVLFPVVMMVFAVPMMGWWGGGMGGRFSPVWGLGMMLVPLVVLAGLGYILYRGLAGSGGGSTRATDRALEELRLAYARGDLTDEEFEERRAKLSREESE